MEFTLLELAERVDGRVLGEGACRISGVATLANAVAGQISFLTNPRYRRQLADSRASAILLNEETAVGYTGNAIVVANPHLAYARIAALFVPQLDHPSGVHPRAEVHPEAEIGSGASIGANTVIGRGVKIGVDCIIGPNCVIEQDCVVGAGTRLVANVTVYYGCTLGERCLIHAGAVIGSDGFGFANDRGSWVKVPQLGAVRIGNEVEIGSNTSVDRGAIEDTVIGNGVIIDNQVQVAHNVRIGDHTAIAGCVGIAGSAVIGRHCALGGGAGILGHLEIVDGVTVTAMSLVTNSIKVPGVYSAGTPLEPKGEWQKNYVRFKQLDDMARRLKALEKTIAKLTEEGSEH